MARHYITRTGRTVEEREDGFRETLAPARQYYPTSEIQSDTPSGAGVRPTSGIELFVRWVAGIITVLLVFRFVFSLVNASTSNGLTSTVYNTTNGFVRPFANLFNYHVSSGVGFFDAPALAAMVVVSLISWALIRLLRIGRA